MLRKFKDRSYELERLDTGDYSPVEYARWQREMWFIHRLFGEVRALRNSIGREIKRSGENRVSILDIGAGSGSLLESAKDWKGDQMLLVGVETNEIAAREMLENDISAVQANGLNLPFGDGSFDYVICSLFMHHLAGDAPVHLLREMSRLARRKIVVIDLHRSPIAYYLYRVAGWLFLQNFSLEDGALSILRGFNAKELRSLAEEAGLAHVSVRRSAVFRLVLTAC